MKPMVMFEEPSAANKAACTRVYIAAKFMARQRLMPYREKLEKKGYEVLSTWMTGADLDETSPGSSITGTLGGNYICAIRDLDEIKRADIFILDTVDESWTGGRDVEFGMALGYNLAAKFLRIGPVRNVFHVLAFEYPSWDELLEAL